MLIISKTPFRISFCGGGTDLRDYYSTDFGSVLSTAINKYMYICVKDYFDKDKIFVKYSKTEFVSRPEELQHEILKETLNLLGIRGGIEIASLADIPSATGLGSSSSFTVGLLNALYAYLGKHRSSESLAREASKIEIEHVKSPIGKQDQYIAAYGGLKYIRFNSDETVLVEPVHLNKNTKKELEKNLLLFYTGITRKTSDILTEQKSNTQDKKPMLDKMRDLSIELKESLSSGNISRFGELLHSNWEIKKQLASKISNPQIESWYQRGIDAGALGGKILGAGGGGFLLFYCEPEKQEKLKMALNELRNVDFNFEPHGSGIVYTGE